MKNLIIGLLLLSVTSLPALAQTLSQYIVIDQFGYLPDSRKIAVIRDPQTGFDANESFTPGATYAVVRSSDNQQIFSGALTSWNSGTTDASSGDKVWWFDFSAVTEAGNYYILDVTKNLKSFEFDISAAVYNELLKHAVRTFFYQRAGFEKSAQYAGPEWADGASHIGLLQDKNCRVYNAPGNASTELDLSGGWYDAGDYNKYTNWTANYVTDFMRAYLEAPSAWGDDYNLPESGNGVPDLLDEAKWGLDHLLRMQRPNGSMLSIVGLAHGSPPSSATGQSLYGTPNTSGTLNSSAAFAVASKVYASIGMTTYAETLEQAAIAAWEWADANPNVIFRNNDAASGTAGLGAGQQETDDYGRLTAKIEAAIFLFELTGETTYRDFVDDHYDEVNLIQWNFAFPFQTTNQEMLLYYASLPNATPAVATAIRTIYRNAMNNGSENFPAFTSNKDPYRAHLQDYTWGSNGIKAAQGMMYRNMITFNLDNLQEAAAMEAAEQYLHYLHGVNPLNLVYLSNMYDFGGDHCVNEFYHSWFSNGSPAWDRVGVSTYGPAPGFVTGGPNPSYDWDGCCPSNCGSSANNALCNSESITPPKGQPKQKSYKDFNTSWPLNSWSVTENSNGYQMNYIRLLSHFVNPSYDCSGTENGLAFIDVCGQCAGGTTGITPVSDESECNMTSVDEHFLERFRVYPNPTAGSVSIVAGNGERYYYEVLNALGKRMLAEVHFGDAHFSLASEPSGLYFVLIRQEGGQRVEKIVKN